MSCSGAVLRAPDRARFTLWAPDRDAVTLEIAGAAPPLAMAGAIKARWICEQAHQQLKEELGLDHF